jgi:dihydrofolate synthase/folylpolyglutamate synthase
MAKTGMDKVVSYVNTNRGNGRRKNLDRLSLLLEHFGNPQNDSKYIHITGTNGKGSSSSMLSSILRESGLEVGVFTSPHLEEINERIRINETLISDDDFIRIVNLMEPIVLELEEKFGETFYAFELMTLCAFLYFQEKQPDLVILEAGIGGRLDATNVIDTPEVALITSIGLDHMAILGDSKEAITYEKAHLLKKNGQMVVGPIDEPLKTIIETRAKEVKGNIVFLDTHDIEITQTTSEYQVFNYKSMQDIQLGFLGIHQVENACLVIEACRVLKGKGYKLTDTAIRSGLEKAYWPGRFEKLLDKPVFYIDGAHNVDGVKRLVETLEKSFAETSFHFVIGMMADKDYQTMINQVKHLAKEFILISPDQARGFNPNELVGALEQEGYQVIVKESAAEVLFYIQEEIPKNETVIQFGSLYLVGDIKKLFHD